MFILPLTVQKKTGLALPIKDSIKPHYIDGRLSPRSKHNEICTYLENHNTTIYVCATTEKLIRTAIASQNISFL